MARCVGPRGNLEGERKRGLRMNNKDLNLKERERFSCSATGLWEKGGRQNIPLFPAAACNELG